MRISKKEKQVTESNFKEYAVSYKRVTKVVKGGRKFSLTALFVVGDQKGNVGFGHGKAPEVADAKKKAINQARKNIVRVPLKENRTLHHDVIGVYGASRVILRSAPPGTGIIAGGEVRKVLAALGVQDVVGKSTGSNNENNIIRATFDALLKLSSPKHIAEKRNKKVSEIISNRESTVNHKSIENEVENNTN
nr:30S ribosomal protein S5 [Rickettsiales endosymbiont of Stachyamoeba lipophora]